MIEIHAQLIHAQLIHDVKFMLEAILAAGFLTFVWLVAPSLRGK